MMKKRLVVLLIFATSCNPEQSGQIQTAGNETTTRSNTAGDTTVRTTNKPLTNKNDIIGIWASAGNEPLTVEINKVSIYYTEHFESYTYILKGDSIFINYPDYVFAAKIYFNKDTLVMQSEDGKSKYVKFNP